MLSAVAAKMLPEYFETLPEGLKLLTIKEGDTLDLGGVTLRFHTAPMVHWPEVMMAYCPEHKVLFSADAFGTFGTLDTTPADWATEARRYYYNIVGKYGPQVQNALKKLSALEIETICPLHGPILNSEPTATSGFMTNGADMSRKRTECSSPAPPYMTTHSMLLNISQRVCARQE